MAEKIKILMLGVNDNPAPGHLLYAYHHLPPEYEACVVLDSAHGNNRYMMLYQNPIVRGWKRLWHRNVWPRLLWCFRYGVFPKVDKSRGEYHFKGNELISYSAKDILKHCPEGFVPDVIAIYWVSGFLTTRVVRDLHEMTGAKILYNLVDEAHLTGGCHYPCDCRGFLTNCSNCPALIRGKRLSSIQLAEKKKNLNRLPLYIVGTPYDIQLAVQTDLFKEAVPLSCVTLPDVYSVSRMEARKRWGLEENDFVVLLGAASLSEERKGIIYAIRALLEVNPKCPNLKVIVAGSDSLRIRQELASVVCHYVGMLSMQDLNSAFCASDVFLSPTVADSGPMMVNIASALGIPTVAFPVGIATTLVRHKETGFMARLKDIHDMASGLLFIANLPQEESEQMSRRCRNLLCEAASKGRWEEQLLRIFSISTPSNS